MAEQRIAISATIKTIKRHEMLVSINYPSERGKEGAIRLTGPLWSCGDEADNVDISSAMVRSILLQAWMELPHLVRGVLGVTPTVF